MSAPLSGPPIGEPDQKLPGAVSGRTLARGVAWVGASRWSSQALSWVVTLVVVRILSPTDYGVLGMTTFFITLAGVFAESGIGAAVIALRDLTPQVIRQLHGLAIGTGLLAAGLSAAISWPASRYFHEPALVPVMAVLGISFALDGLRIVPVALLNRDLNYQRAASRLMRPISLRMRTKLDASARRLTSWDSYISITGT